MPPESPLPDPLQPLLPEELLDRVERQIFQDEDDVQTGVSDSRLGLTRLLQQERLERLKTLRPRLLIINKEDPLNSPDLLQIEHLYTSNLIPNEAFLALEHDDHLTFTLASERGGMLNRFQPTPAELGHYDNDYETVRDQIIRDLSDGPDSIGDYRMIGLFDEQDILRASLSYRLPPRKPSVSTDIAEYSRKLQLYSAYLMESLLLDQRSHKRREMVYANRWDKDRLKAQFPDLWEIDTFNVDQEWRGAGYLVLQSALDQIKAERGEIPEAVFCYRFSGINRRDPETGQHVLVGPNRGSRTFLENLGFHDMAHKAIHKEVVIREMPDGNCHEYHPEWLYLHNGRNRLQRQLEQHLREMGLWKC